MGIFNLFRKKQENQDGRDLYHFRGKPEAYFEMILTENFPEYEIRKQVQMASLSVQSEPVTFLLVKDNRMVLALLLCHSQEYDRSWIMNTIRACEQNRIPVQRYYKEFRNKETYICDRIRSVLP